MRPKFLKQLIVGILLPLIINQPVLLYAATITVDPATNTIIIDRAQNGVPVVNIVAPNSRGMSHNKFKNFNVDRNGVILNNSNNLGVSTLGGALYKNPNLVGRSQATLILNEVTGVSRSTLNGFTEVFGGRANYVLANPNGITCSGCGFINTGRTTLTTGRPEIANGFLKNLNVQGGDVTIGSGGLNAENLSYFEIIARTAILQGQINAKDLNIVTGRNDYDYETKQVTAKPGDGSQKPTLSIDGSSLGSIYADKIKIISTEAGVGVKAPANMIAYVSDVMIDSQGNITNKNITAVGNVTLNSGGKIETSGKTEAKGNLALTANEVAVTSDGILKSYNDVTINAIGKIANSGKVLASNNVDVNGQELDNSGEIQSEKNVKIVVQQVLNSGSVKSNEHVDIDAQTLTNSGQILSNNVNITSAMQNTGSIEGSSVFLKGSLINRNSISAWSLLDIETNMLDNDGGQLFSGLLTSDNTGYTGIESFGKINLRFDGDLILKGDLFSTGDIDIAANSLDNRGNIKSLYGLKIQIAGLFKNESGYITAGVFDHPDFDFNTFGTLDIDANDVVNKKLLYSTGSLDVDSALSISNSDTIFSEDTVTLHAYQGITNNASSQMYSVGNTILSANAANSTVYNLGIIKTGGSLNIEAKSVTNKDSLYSAGNMVVTAGGSITNDNSITSEGSLTLNAGQQIVNSSGSQIYSEGNSTLSAGTTLSNAGSIRSDGDLSISASDVANNSLLYSAGNLNINASNSISNSYLIFSRSGMNLYAGQQIYNARNSYLYSLGQMILTTRSNGNITNHLGTIKTENGDMYITTGTLNNESTLAGSYYLSTGIVLDPSRVRLTKDDDIGFSIIGASLMGGWLDDAIRMGYIVDTGDGLIIPPYLKTFIITVVEASFATMTPVSTLTTPEYSVINSGRNLVINSNSVNNISSDIIAAGNIYSTGAVNNIRGSMDAPFTTYYVKLHNNLQDIQEERLFNADRDFYNLLHGYYSEETVFSNGCGFWSGCLDRGTYAQLLSQYIDIRSETTTGKVYSNRASKFISGGSVYMTSGPGTPGQASTSGTLYRDIAGDLNQPYSVNTQRPNIDVKVDGVFFRYASGASYVIEINPLLTDVKKMMSSDYFIQKAGYNKDQFNSLFMGDSYWEKEYIAKQIENDFHRKFIVDGVDSDALQRDLLLSNALEISGGLKLALGVELTEEQRKALTKPIVWYVTEEKVVNGKTVSALVPKVYAPLNADFDISAGSVLSAKNIYMDTNNDVMVAGTMYADSLASVKAKNFTLSNAKLKASNLNVKLDKDFNINSSKVSVSDTAYLDVVGDVNITGKKVVDAGIKLHDDGFSEVYSRENYIGSTIDIGNNLISKSNNFTMRGSDINVGNSASIETLGDMTIASEEEKYASVKRKYETGSWTNTEKEHSFTSTTQKSSNINVGNQLSITTGNDFNMLASNINADKVFVEAKGNINLVSALNESEEKNATRKSSMVSKEVHEVSDYKGTNVGSSINAGSINYTKADGDINLIASSLSAKSGIVSMEANNINVVAAKDIEGHTDYYKKVNLLDIGSLFSSIGSFLTGGDLEFGSFKEGTKVSKQEIASASSISGATVAIKTKNDMNVIGSDISGGKISMDIGRDLNMMSLEQVANYSSESKEGKLYISADISGISSVSLEGGVKYTAKKDTQKDVTNRVSTIKGGDVAIHTGQDLVSYGSDISSTGNMAINVGRDLKEYAVHDTSESTSETTNVRTGVKLSLTANPLAFAEGIGGLGMSLADGSMVKGLGSVNGIFSDLNEVMDDSAKINKIRTKDENGNLKFMSSSGLSYFMDVNKTTTTQNSSTVVGSNISAGGTLTANVGRDAILHGSNVSGNEVDMTIGRNLDIVSEFDASNSKTTNVSMGMNIGLTGASAGSKSISGNVSQSTSDIKWLNNQSGITSNGKMNVKVGGNTNLEGGIIASNTGDLNLTTQTLTYSDLTGHDTSSTYGGGRSVDLQLSKQSTNIKYGSSDKEQVAHATIGTGNVTVGEGSASLVGLNRDVTKSLEITKDNKIDLIDINVDDRLLTSEGRRQIADDLRKALVTTGDLAKSTGDVISGDLSLDRGADLFQLNVNREDVMAKMATSDNADDRNAALILANQAGYTADQKAAATQRYYQNLAIETGTTPTDAAKLALNIYDSSDGKKGFYVKDGASKGEIDVNSVNNNLGKEAFVNTVGHETAHATDKNTDSVDREQFAQVTGDGTWDALNNGLFMSRADYGMKEQAYTPTFSDNVSTSMNGYKANAISENAKENLFDSPSYGSADFYSKNVSSISTGMAEGGAAGAAAFGVVVLAPAAMSALGAAYDATGLIGLTAISKAAEFQSNNPELAKKVTQTVEFLWNDYVSPPTMIPSTIAGAAGWRANLTREYGAPFPDLYNIQEEINKINESIIKGRKY